MTQGGDILRALLPSGEAWPTSVPELVRDDVLDGLGRTYDRVRQRARDLIEESFPGTAVEMLPEWESALGLPDSCAPLADTVAERQRRAHAKLIRRGGYSFAYFIAIAAALGFDIHIDEHPAATCESACDVGLDPDDLVINGKPAPWCFVIDIIAPAETYGELDCLAGGCDEPLRWWSNDYLECVLRREFRRNIATRHLFVRFFYGVS